MSCTFFKKHLLVDKGTIVVPDMNKTYYFGRCKILKETPLFEAQLRFCNSDDAFVECEHYKKETANRIQPQTSPAEQQIDDGS